MRVARLLGVLVVAFGALSFVALAAAADAKAPKTLVAADFPLRVNVGGEEYKDARGNTWKADKEFSKGSFGYVDGDEVDRGADVKVGNSDLAGIFQAERYGLSSYKVSVPAAGKYTVGLLWAETFDGISGPGERSFSVSINGKKVLNAFDPTKEAGGVLKAVAKTFVVDAKDVITIEFGEDVQSPTLNGIVVVSGDGAEAAKIATEGVGKVSAKPAASK
jgi:hypothetical protein